MDVLYEACQKSCERWVENFEQDNREQHIFSKHHQRAMHSICDKIKYPHFTKRMMIALVAALIVLLITTSIFALSRYKEYIIEKFATHAVYSVVPDTKTKDINNLEIGYVPDGFMTEEENTSELFYQRLYSNNNLYFNVKKYKLGTDISFDTEEYDYEELIIEDMKYILYSSTEDLIGVMWNNGEYQFLIFGNIEKDEIIKIAMSIN